MTSLAPPRKVLTVDAVRRSIDTLHKPFIHEQFLAYLHIRKRGIEEGATTNIEPVWAEVSKLLAVDGGPTNKPNYLPFSSRTTHDPSRYWKNSNIAGSYAPSSLRRKSRFMLDASERKFSLPADHAQQALAVHLDNHRQPAWPFAGFFLRNYSFDSSAATVADLIDGFCQLFRFDATGAGSDFDTLFTTGTEPDIAWFESMPVKTTKESAGMVPFGEGDR
ncbi:hypothetical protein ACWDYH_15310 [Nocardia goodfellowii]